MLRFWMGVSLAWASDSWLKESWRQLTAGLEPHTYDCNVTHHAYLFEKKKKLWQ